MCRHIHMEDKPPITIFVASSADLKEERISILPLIRRLNKRHKHLKLELMDSDFDLVSNHKAAVDVIPRSSVQKLKESRLIVFIFSLRTDSNEHSLFYSYYPYFASLHRILEGCRKKVSLMMLFKTQSTTNSAFILRFENPIQSYWYTVQIFCFKDHLEFEIVFYSVLTIFLGDHYPLKVTGKGNPALMGMDKMLMEADIRPVDLNPIKFLTRLKQVIEAITSEDETVIPIERPVVSDGEPTQLKVDENNLNSIARNLKNAFRQLDIPRPMKVGKIYRVKLSVARYLDQLARTDDTIDIKEIKIVNQVKVTLLGEKFTIVSLNNSNQKLVTENQPSEWNWDVTPKSSGVQKLIFIVSTIVNIPGEGNTEQEIKLSEETVRVKVNIPYTTGHLIKTYWQWAIGLLVGTGVLWKVIDYFSQKK